MGGATECRGSWWHPWYWVLPLLLLQQAHQGRSHLPPSPSHTHCPGCPYFLDTPTHLVTAVGAAANLTCGVRMLGDRQVSWIRRRDLHVLTTDTFTYTTDSRFRAIHAHKSPYWILRIENPTISDSGMYECQVSAQPKIYRRFHLSVVVPRATIPGTGAIFMKAGSDINITCVITGASKATPVTWYHITPQSRSTIMEELNSGTRGGVQLVTDRRAGTSWLLVTQATWRDAGNYTCAPAHATPASVSVHILNEKTPAAMQPDLQTSPGAPASPSSSSSSSSSSASSFVSARPPGIFVPSLSLPLTLFFVHRLFFKLINFPRDSSPPRNGFANLLQTRENCL